MKLIPLTKGYHAIIDDADYERVSQMSWHITVTDKARGTIYVKGYIRGTGKKTEVYLHRFLMTPPKGMVVDHINRNPLDNRRENLRICTHSQNIMNSNRKGSLGFIGVTKHGVSGYIAQCKDHAGPGKSYVGRFATPEEAAAAYDRAALAARGEFARLNFPVAA